MWKTHLEICRHEVWTTEGSTLIFLDLQYTLLSQRKKSTPRSLSYCYILQSLSFQWKTRYIFAACTCRTCNSVRKSQKSHFIFYSILDKYSSHYYTVYFSIRKRKYNETLFRSKIFPIKTTTLRRVFHNSTRQERNCALRHVKRTEQN